MESADKRMVLVVALVVAGALLAIGFFLARPRESKESWTTEFEGLLAVPSPCCTEATLWESIDAISEDGQRPKPATAEDAARWLNTWPYQPRGDDAGGTTEAPGVGIKNSEVRCVGTPTGPDIVPGRNDAYTLEAVRLRRECVFTKWRVWDIDAPEDQLNERHTIWGGEDGFFYGRVDYWR